MLSSTDFHSDFAALRIATSEIGVVGLQLRRELGANALSALVFEAKNPDFAWISQKSASLSCNLVRENDFSFLVDIVADMLFACPCARCLEMVQVDVPLSFSIRMLEMEHLGLTEDDVLGWSSDAIQMDLTEDDDVLVGYYAKRTLDLGLIIRDQLFLELPDYPHCDMGKDALQASRCKVLSPALAEADLSKDNPFVKKFGKAK